MVKQRSTPLSPNRPTRRANRMSTRKTRASRFTLTRIIRHTRSREIEENWPMRTLVLLTTMVGFFGFVPAVSGQDARVTVISILASDRHKNIDERLKGLAEEIRKREPNLTGWRGGETSQKSMTLNQKENFHLIADVNSEITILARDDKDKKVKLTVKSPHSGEVTYTTVPDKFFPIVTRYQTEKEKERLVF